MIIPSVSEIEWRMRLDGLPLWQPPQMHVLVIAPHPDDETLAAGGLIAALRSRGTEVTVVAVTDGENAYADAGFLGELREQEQTAALERLGVEPEQIVRLRLPDSGVTACEPRLVEMLLPLISADMHLVAPWHKDFHPDHEACGRAAETVARMKKIPLTFYFFWTWHRGTVDTLDGLPLLALPLTGEQRRAKHEALLCHRSQLTHASGSPILPEDLLAPAYRPFEVFVRS